MENVAIKILQGEAEMTYNTKTGKEKYQGYGLQQEQ